MSTNPLQQIQNNSNHSRSHGGSFKKVLDATECRRAREETTIQLRKNRKDEMLRKRRNMMSVAASAVGGDPTLATIDIQALPTINDSVEKFQRWILSGKQIILRPTDTSNTENNNNALSDNMEATTNDNGSLICLQDLLDAVRTLRKMLSTDKNPPIQPMLNHGVVFFLVEMIDVSPLLQQITMMPNSTENDSGKSMVLELYSKLVFEATWALTNIASTEHANTIVQYPNAIERLIELVTYEKDATVREQSIWCLGNIAGDNIYYRDMLLHDERVKVGFLQNLRFPDSSSLLSNVGWAISNLCRKISTNTKNNVMTANMSTKTALPQPTIQSTRCFIHPLYYMIRTAIDIYRDSLVYPERVNHQKLKLHEMIIDAMWCLTYISDGDNSRIQILLDDGRSLPSDENYSNYINDSIVLCIKDILQMHNMPTNEKSAAIHYVIDRSLLVPSIRCLGNIASGTNEHTSVIVDSGILKYIPDLLAIPSKALKKEICWMLSNIAAGTVEHIWSIFEAERLNGLVCKLIRLSSVRNNECMNVRKEAIWTLCNIITTGNAKQHSIVLKLQAIDPLCDVLASTTYRHDTKLLLTVMDAIECILYKNELNGTSYDRMIDEYEGVEALENLQDHPSDEVYRRASSMLEKYFNGVAESTENSLSMILDGPIKFDFSSATWGDGSSAFSSIDNLPLPPKQLFPTNNN